MGKDRIVLDSFSEDLKDYSKAIGSFDVTALIDRQKLKLDTGLMIGSFRQEATPGASPADDWIYQGQVQGLNAFGIGRLVGSGIGIIEGAFNKGPNGWGSWMDQRTTQYEGMMTTDDKGVTSCNGYGCLLYTSPSPRDRG